MTQVALPMNRNTTTYDPKRNNPYARKIAIVNTVVMVLLILTILLSVVIPEIISANGPTGSVSTYEHLMDGTFYNAEGTTSRSTALMQKFAASILGKVLPFMTIYALTLMVISMSSTVIYLSNPDFFDEVHVQHRLRKEQMKDRKGLGGVSEFLKMLGPSSGISFIKGVIIPDVKAQAFYEACELGEDGRPSMMTFFKYSFPKYMVIIAMIIMINDRTMLDLYFRGAEIGVYFFQKAAYDFHYPDMIDRFLNTGSKYDPGWTKGKKSVFDKIYTSLLNADKRDGTETADYRQKVGSLLARKMEGTINKDVDFESYKVASHVRIDSIPYAEGQVPNETYQWPLTEFGVHPGDSNKFITVTVSLSDRNKTSSLETSETTTYPGAWTGVDGSAPTSVTFDLDQTAWKPTATKGADGKDKVDYSAYGFESQPVVVFSDGSQTQSIPTLQNSKVTINFANPSGKKITKITFMLKTPQGRRHVRYINSALVNEAINPEKPGTGTKPKK